MAEKKKPKKSGSQIQESDQTRPTLAYLTADQAVCLSSILLQPTDTKAIESLGWSKYKFYKNKKVVKPLKDAYAQELTDDIMIALSLAGRYAVSTYIELLSERNKTFRKEVADEIMDRIGVIKKTPEDKPAAPLVTAIIAQKVERYDKAD